MQAHGLTQGNVLALCASGQRLQMRSDMAHAMAATPKTPAVRSGAKAKYQNGSQEATKQRRYTPYSKTAKQAKVRQIIFRTYNKGTY